MSQIFSMVSQNTVETRFTTTIKVPENLVFGIQIKISIFR